MSENSDSLVALGVGAAAAAGAAYLATRGRGEQNRQQGTESNGGVSTAALMALLASQNSGGDSGTTEPDVPDGEPAHRYADPTEHGDTSDALGDDGSYTDSGEGSTSGSTSSPDDGASGEPTTEADRDRTFADPGLSTYVEENPDANIGDFRPVGDYTIAQDKSRFDKWQWIVLKDSGRFIDSFATEEEAESEALGEPEHRSADPTEHGDRTFDEEDSTTTDDYDYDEHNDSNDYSTGDAMDDVGDGEFTSDEEEDFWTGNL